MGIDEGNVINHPTNWILEPKYNQLGLENKAEFYATYYVHERKIRPGCLADMAMEMYTLTNYIHIYIYIYIINLFRNFVSDMDFFYYKNSYVAFLMFN